METTEVKTIFEIPSVNMGNFTSKIEVLNKKAKRLKCPPILTNILKVYTSTETHEPIDAPSYQIATTFYSVEVLGASPVLPGWQFLGTLEHVSDVGNVLRSVPGRDIPERFRTGGQRCDHCNLVRSRKNTYIVQNLETLEVKQVGHQCVADYLGRVSPQALALFAEVLRELSDLGGDSEGDSEGGGGQLFTSHPLEFLELASTIVLQRGFVSRAASQAYSDKSDGQGHIQPTSEVTMHYLFPSPEMIRKGDQIRVTDAGRELAKSVLEWVNSAPSNSNYIHNLKITLSKPFLTWKDAGLAASAVGAYQKEMGLLAERKAKSKPFEKSIHFGTVGVREVFTLTVIGDHVFANDFGNVILYRMLDVSGNVATWWSSSGKLDTGSTYQIKATVKAHSDYKGIKQTVLTRCTVVKDLGPATPQTDVQISK